MIPKYIFEQLIKENEQDFNEMSWITYDFNSIFKDFILYRTDLPNDVG